MTRKEFISMYKSLCPKGDAEHFASHIFLAFDLDKSNTVDFREFLIGLSMTSTTSSPQTKLEWLFQVFDIDGNGVLTRNECLEVIDTIVRFNQSQQDNEQYSSTENLVRSAKRCMMRIFDNASDGRSNTLTITQFVEGCQKDELIFQLLAPTSGIRNDSSITQNTYDISTIDQN
jgi:Ca2+-binding EF-hand superfamily protein